MTTLMTWLKNRLALLGALEGNPEPSRTQLPPASVDLNSPAGGCVASPENCEPSRLLVPT